MRSAACASQYSTEINIRFSIESVHFWRRFEDEMGGLTAGYREEGYLLLAQTPAERDLFARNVALQNQLGVPSRLLEPSDAADIVPGLFVDDLSAATYSAEDGIAVPNDADAGIRSSRPRRRSPDSRRRRRHRDRYGPGRHTRAGRRHDRWPHRDARRRQRRRTVGRSRGRTRRRGRAGETVSPRDLRLRAVSARDHRHHAAGHRSARRLVLPPRRRRAS